MCFGSFFLKDACGREQRPDVAAEFLNTGRAVDASVEFTDHVFLRRPRRGPVGVLTPYFHS